jgi:putative endopeptidase
MKRVWFAAAAMAALSLSAFGAQAREHDTPASTTPAPCSRCSCRRHPGRRRVDLSLESPRYGTWGFDASGMDRSVKPGDDFYKFANGTWDANTEIPSDRTRYGNFDKLAELSEARTKAIITEAAAARPRRRHGQDRRRLPARSWTRP